MNIILTGHSGFIGKKLLDLLLKDKKNIKFYVYQDQINTLLKKYFLFKV